MTKDEALQMCLEYIETDAHERRHVRWAIKEALAQPDEQLLISNILSNYGLQAIDFVADFKEAMKQAEQEHPAPCTKHCEATAFQITIKNLEAQLAQHTWVGLTDEEKSELWEISRAALPRYATYASLIEAKLKEKNT